MIGAAVLAFMVLVALTTPLLMNHDPTIATPQARFARPMAEAAAPETGTYIFSAPTTSGATCTAAS